MSTPFDKALCMCIDCASELHYILINGLTSYFILYIQSKMFVTRSQMFFQPCNIIHRLMSIIPRNKQFVAPNLLRLRFNIRSKRIEQHIALIRFMCIAEFALTVLTEPYCIDIHGPSFAIIYVDHVLVHWRRTETARM